MKNPSVSNSLQPQAYSLKPIIPKEALEFLENKGWKLSFDYSDVWREEHACAFIVAKTTKLNILKSIRNEVEKALEEGRTLAQFQDDLEPVLQKLGWWGKKEMDDPLTGDKVEAQLGSPHRLRIIYRTNLRIARAAGQWERIQRTKDALPYLMYTLGSSREHRLEHLAWDGLILPVDDPFWKTHYPPNGWGCKCRVRQISKYEMEKQDLKVGASPKIETKTWINQRTGEVLQVPVGINPGWDYNPGMARKNHLDKILAEKIKLADSL